MELQDYIFNHLTQIEHHLLFLALKWSPLTFYLKYKYLKIRLLAKIN